MQSFAYVSRYAKLGIVVAVLFVLAAIGIPPANAEKPDEQPNIVVVLVDDLRFDEMGFMGADVPTPAIDRLAEEGVVFKNAFVTTSLCSPSRASLLTGMAMRNHGVVDNNVPLADELTIFPEKLQSAGYATALVGKWHMGSGADPRRGFDHWVSFPGQGSYLPRDLLGRQAMLNINGEAVPQQGYITDELTDHAAGWLTGLDRDRPFLLYIAHKGVHAPFTPAKRHSGSLAASPPELSQSRTGDEPGTPMWVTNQRNSWHGVEFAYHDVLAMGEFRRDYRETLRSVDDSIGRLRATLGDLGELENTIIFVTSDNGFLLGEHGLIDKRNAYEASMRVPMIVWGPQHLRTTGELDTIVANIDLAPTILDLAAAEPLPSADGVSFAPVLMGGEDAQRSDLVYEYYWEFNYPQTPTTFALRDERFKYIQYHGVWDTEELFDLVADPFETRNLVADPAYRDTLIDMRLRLFAGLEAQDGSHSIAFSRKFNQGAVFRLEDGSRAAQFPERWLRSPGAFDRLEHIIPDGPQKEALIERLNEALAADE
ncbi:MAG: sulfatase family protein [Erythrobacter sp.]